MPLRHSVARPWCPPRRTGDELDEGRDEGSNKENERSAGCTALGFVLSGLLATELLGLSGCASSGAFEW